MSIVSTVSTAGLIVGDSILIVDLAEAAESTFAVDPRRRIVYWSPTSQELLGFSAEDVMGRRCCDVLRACGGGGSGSGAGCACGQCLRPGAKSGTVKLVTQFTTQVMARDGQAKQLCVTAVRSHSTAGDVRIIHFMRELRAPASLPRAANNPHPDSTQGAPVPEMLPSHLTTRELEVLRLLASGLGTAEIAAALSISPITARNHITRLIEKLEVKTRLQAVIAASHRGLI